jgi:hypothetical protein
VAAFLRNRRPIVLAIIVGCFLAVGIPDYARRDLPQSVGGACSKGEKLSSVIARADLRRKPT